MNIPSSSLDFLSHSPSPKEIPGHTAMFLIKALRNQSLHDLQKDQTITLAEILLKNGKVALDYTLKGSSFDQPASRNRLYIIAKEGDGPTILQGLYPQAFLPLGHNPEQGILFYEEKGKIKFLSNKDLQEIHITPENLTIFPEALFFQFPGSPIFYALQRNHKNLTLEEILSGYPATTAILSPGFF